MLEIIKRNKKDYVYISVFIYSESIVTSNEGKWSLFFLMSMATTFVVTATGTVFLYFSSMQDMWRTGGYTRFRT